MTTIQIRSNGNITLPHRLCKKYNLTEGKFLTLIDLGDGTFILRPGISQVDKLSRRMAKNLKKDKITAADILIGLDEERKKYFDENYKI
jgi:bifunctional DNA-binding transcriptional regulator/antitoxin component of YhaV-PrlF toxin-antitoxin module